MLYIFRIKRVSPGSTIPVILDVWWYGIAARKELLSTADSLYRKGVQRSTWASSVTSKPCGGQFLVLPHAAGSLGLWLLFTSSPFTALTFPWPSSWQGSQGAKATHYLAGGKFQGLNLVVEVNYRCGGVSLLGLIAVIRTKNSCWNSVAAVTSVKAHL